ncbi:uncharacterized protein LOC130516539 [Takifugu flavidus]|uniref:uncharacterized protein LOC130516539 n=1 Tax=Takifugu flavidus TaxID=433684 RepID=UPI0025443BBD|nr:uncharacterized protein LOC130516539 [Takifugu flavidus]
MEQKDLFMLLVTVGGCCSTYTSVSGLKAHLGLCTKGEFEAGKYRCLICNKEFNSESGVKYHINSIHSEDWFVTNKKAFKKFEKFLKNQSRDFVQNVAKQGLDRYHHSHLQHHHCPPLRQLPAQSSSTFCVYFRNRNVESFWDLIPGNTYTFTYHFGNPSPFTSALTTLNLHVTFSSITFTLKLLPGSPSRASSMSVLIRDLTGHVGMCISTCVLILLLPRNHTEKNIK